MIKLENLTNLKTREYSFYDNGGDLDALNNLENMLEDLEDRAFNEEYICDVLSEIADNYIPLYTDTIWKEAALVREHIEEVIVEYGELVHKDLLKTFQYGIFSYNQNGLYENVFTVIYNLALQYLDVIYESEKDNIKEAILKLTEEDIEDAIKNISTDSYLSEISDAIEELVETLK